LSRFTVSIAGASGYTGLEAIRYLGFHPDIRIGNLYGGISAGKVISDIYPALSRICDVKITSIEELAGETADAVLMGLPHGTSAEAANRLISGGYKGYIIDMGSDFRLRNSDDYKTWYGYDHAFPGLIPHFVYGLTEIYRSEILRAKYIANPGCFASALQLAIAPAIKNGLISGKVHVTGITGSTGSGASPTSGTHFSTRFANVKAYKVLEHQHMAEVNQTLASLSSRPPEVLFVPVSGPVTRGIWLTASFTLKEESAGDDIHHAYRSFYQGAPMVRLRTELPELKAVTGTAFTDIGIIQKGRNVVVGSAIDNLGKGAAGQAIQNLNLMLGLPEERGLIIPPMVF
jgi:LysW-gamma-L-alpha-aminoadipyl-6-phosphate/LysW-L-glutamyl-5-phosphate reductase